MVHDTIYPLIEAQQSALSAINGKGDYSLSFSGRVSILPLTGQDPTEQIYLARVDLATSADGTEVSVTCTWTAVIVAPPGPLMQFALRAQAEMLHAMKVTPCHGLVTRGQWNEAANDGIVLNSNTALASIVVRQTVNEVE